MKNQRELEEADVDHGSAPRVRDLRDRVRQLQKAVSGVLQVRHKGGYTALIRADTASWL